MTEIREVLFLTDPEYAQLVNLLVDVVDGGAAISFLAPLSPAVAADYWGSVLGPSRVLLVAEHEGRILGSAQLHLVTWPNGPHRAEVAKVMVHPAARRRGIARALMERLDVIARREDRTLLVLDTREGDPSNSLYTQAGFQEAGRIPDYAYSSTGELHATVLYYKVLGEHPTALGGAAE
jgi:ribosomal protein S18 acetylase RimI-like enzyme